MNKFCCLAMLVMWPVVATAAPVALRTGEHSDFTRIVAFVPAEVDWRIGRTPTGYILRLPVAEGYDLTGFFDPIPTERIKSVSQDIDRGELRLVVDCICNVRAFSLRPTVLVMDVRDGPPQRRSSFELALPALEPTVQRDTVPLPEAYKVARNPLLPLFPTAPILDTPELAPPGASVVADDVEDLPPTDASQMDIAVLEQAVTQSLARGLTSGVLEGAPLSEQVEVEGALMDGGTALAQLPGVASRTSVDPLADPSAAPDDVTQEGQTCLPDAYFDFASWGDERAFFDQVVAVRVTLVTQTDVVDETAVMTLARLYLHFGFGREVAQTLALDGIQSKERQILAMLGRIIDGDPVAGTALAGQVSCPSDVALWAMLASDTPPLDAQVDRSAVLRAYKALPGPVQDVVAARLSERFLRIGDLDGASQVLNAKSATAAAQVDGSLATAALSEALGETTQARQSVAQVVQSDPRATPEAMVLFLEQGGYGGVGLTEDDFLLADAMRFEHADTEAAVDLTVAQARAYTTGSRFAEANSLLQNAEQQMPEDQRAQLLATNWTEAANRMPDAAFLALIWSEAANVADASAQNAVASRLVDIGFPDRALAVLTAQTEGVVADERKLIQARAALGLGEPVQVASYLEGVTTPEAVALLDRAESMRRVFNFDPTTAPQQDPTQTAPDVFSRQDDASLQTVSALVTQRESVTLDPEAPLAESRALLERSARSRETLAQLLQRFAVPADF
jgi:hypothetical protein